MKIAILGAGSIGMIHGALITKAGYDCTLIDVNREHVDALNKNGAKIVGFYNEAIPVKATTADKLSGIFDVILLHTKQMHMTDALKSIEPYMNNDTMVVTLQNGIPEDKVAHLIGRSRVIGGTVFHGARYIEPGVSELTTEFHCMHTYIGELDGKITPRIKELEKIILATGDVCVTDDILSVKWTKLVMNAALSGMSAALGCTFGEAADNYDSMRCMAYICLEGARIMESKGLKPFEMEGFLPTVENFSFTNREEFAPIDANLKKLIAISYDEIASMLQDIRAGRSSCEIDDINGKVVFEGKEMDIPTPFNEKVVEIVTKIMNKELIPEFENIKYFEMPELH
ncbi:MAG: 2-dehydropantoate 2-reductase [Deltaproteobacteria bacterium]|nr:2-dehydropantoate 2-reductase [Deltaproteobacteria bacterium]